MLSEDQVGGGTSDCCQPTNGRRVSNAQTQKFTHHVVPLCSVFDSCDCVLSNKKMYYENSSICGHNKQ